MRKRLLSSAEAPSQIGAAPVSLDLVLFVQAPDGLIGVIVGRFRYVDETWEYRIWDVYSQSFVYVGLPELSIRGWTIIPDNPFKDR